MIKQSFTLRVLVISFLTLALPLLVDSFIFFQNSYNASIDQAKIELQQKARYGAFSLSEIQPINQILLKELSYFLGLENNLADIDPKKLDHELAQLAFLTGAFHILVLNMPAEEKYEILASSLHADETLKSIFVSYRRLNELLKYGENSFVRYVFSNQQQRYLPYIFMGRTIKDVKTGQKVGVILLIAEIESQIKTFFSETQTSEKISFAILNTDGIVFASSDPALEGEYFDPISPQRRNEILESGQLGFKTLPSKPLPSIESADPSYMEFVFNNQVEIAYRAHVPQTGISVVAYASKEKFFGKAVQHFLIIYTLYGLILVFAGGVTYWLSLWISHPLRQLSHLMKNVRAGDLEGRFQEEKFGFEINLLGTAFNHTLDTLLGNIQHAQDERIKKEIYQKELEIGRKVQAGLIPIHPPQLEGTSFAGLYIPAREAGGDFYEWHTKPGESEEDPLFYFWIGDVSGKGISSCLYSLSLRSFLRAYSSLNLNLGTVLSEANNAFCEDAGDTGTFVTVIGALFHPKTHCLEYYSCGNVPGLLRKANGEIVELAHTGVAMGLLKSTPFSVHTLNLLPGEMVLFFTQGLLELKDKRQEAYGLGRLTAFVKNHAFETSQEWTEALKEELADFYGNEIQDEEILMVVLKILAHP